MARNGHGSTPWRWELYPDAASLADALEAGDVDVAGDLPLDRTKALADLPGLREIAYPTSHLTAAVLNLRNSKSPFRDASVRQALLRAIDREGSRGRGGERPWCHRRRAHRAQLAALRHHRTRADDARRSAATKALRDAGWKKVGGAWQASGAKDPCASRS